MPDRKKANYVLQHVRTDSHCMVDEELLESFMAEVPIIQKPETSPLICKTNHWAWFLYNRNFRHERVNALLLACIH